MFKTSYTFCNSLYLNLPEQSPEKEIASSLSSLSSLPFVRIASLNIQVKQYGTSDDQNEDDEEELYFDALECYIEDSNEKGQAVRQKSEEGERQKSYTALTPQKTHDARNGYTGVNNKAISVEKGRDQFRHLRYRANGTSVLIFPFFISCTGGTSPSKRQVHSDIYVWTFGYVTNCPSPEKYMHRSLEKCANVCGSDMCTYHCMRDSSKTNLVEFCAKPKILFGFCPEYDPVDQTIQKDQATPCNSTSSLTYYNSSDIYYCDPDNCLQLHGSSDQPGATTLTTLMTDSTDMNSGDIQQTCSLQKCFLIPLLFIVVGVAFAIVWILRNFKIFSARPRNERNPKNMEKRMKRALLCSKC